MLNLVERKQNMKTIAGIFFIATVGFLSFNTGCRKPNDPCANVICYNGGKCVEGKCRCAEGWTGPDCSERIKRP